MNEQLVVKNFGPIKDATVDFKRVTVFIGPTGGGKSTLAKLRMIISEDEILSNGVNIIPSLEKYDLSSYRRSNYFIKWISHSGHFLELVDNKINLDAQSISALSEHNEKISKPLAKGVSQRFAAPADIANRIKELLIELEKLDPSISAKIISPDKIVADSALRLEEDFDRVYLKDALSISDYSHYIPAERLLVSTLNLSWPSLIEAKVDLPKTLLDFSKAFLQASKSIDNLELPFLGVTFQSSNGRSLIQLEQGNALQLHETASGIQSVTPLLVLLEHLSRNTEQAQSFIIEEPELNLYPTAQQGLLNWLVEKCTKGENDLTITTHSPYLLAHFNLLLYAYQVAENHPDRAEDVAKIVPRESWISPKEFAAYHVEGQKENGVRSIVNPETGLISYNGLDSTASAETAEFEKLLDINAGLEVE